MNILAFDTSTETLSIALSANGQRYAHHSEGGAKASKSLLGHIHVLLTQAQLRVADLNLIAFGAGPGSFTGLRTACAAAQGLAYAYQIPVLPISCLLATAQQALNQTQASHIQVVLDARMAEVYSGQYEFKNNQWHCLQQPHTVAPQELLPVAQALIAGNAYAVYQEAWQNTTEHFYALPSASAMLDLAPALYAQGQAIAAHLAVPHYVRDKVALSTAERMAKALL